MNSSTTTTTTTIISTLISTATTTNNSNNNNQGGLAPQYTQAAFEFVDLDQRMGLYGGVFTAVCIFFTACLFLSHKFFSSPTNSWCPAYLHQIYVKLPKNEQADWCSRVNSTIHGVAVCIAFPWTLAQTPWTEYPYLLPESDKAVDIRCIMALAAAYFVVDTFVIVLYRVPLWGVFLAHHIAAMTPLFNNIFNRDANCRRATFDLGLFLLVEFCTLFVNAQSWMETCKVKTYYKKTYVAMIHGVFWSWIPLRVVVPLFILVHLYRTVILAPGVLSACMYVPLACAHFITLFCLVVFFGLYVPQMYRRCFGKGPLPEDEADDENEEQNEKGVTGDAASSLPPPTKSSAYADGQQQREESSTSTTTSVNIPRSSSRENNNNNNGDDNTTNTNERGGGGGTTTSPLLGTNSLSSILPDPHKLAEALEESLLQVASSGHI